MTHWLRLSLSTLVFLAGCDASQSQVAISEGTLSDGRYHNPSLGWSMPLPPDWTVMSVDDIRSYTGKGRAIMEKSLGERIEENQTDLLYLRTGTPGTAFTSARQPFDKTAGPYAETQEMLFKVVAQAYRDAGIAVRVERRQETVGGVTFEVMHVSIRTRDDREVGQQYVYDALFGEQSLIVSVTAVDAVERGAGLRAWRASTFERRPDGAAQNPSP